MHVFHILSQGQMGIRFHLYLHVIIQSLNKYKNINMNKIVFYWLCPCLPLIQKYPKFFYFLNSQIITYNHLQTNTMMLT